MSHPSGFVHLSLRVACVALFCLSGCAAARPETAEVAPLSAERKRFAPVLSQGPFGRDVARAVSSHPVVASGAARLRSADADLQAAHAARMPRLAIGLDLEAALAGSVLRSGYLPVVQVSQLLFDGGRTRASIEAAKLGVSAERHARETAASQLTLAAVEAWHELAHRRDLRGIAERSVAEHRHALDRIEDRLSAGAATESDVLVARSRLADAIAVQATAVGEVDRSEAGFFEIYGYVPGALPVSAPAPQLPALSDQELLETSPRLLGLHAEIEAAGQVVAALDAGRWPLVDINMVGQYDRTTDRAAARLASGPRMGVLTGGERAAARARAVARLDELRAEYLQLERQIIRALGAVQSDTRVGERRVVAARDALAANRASVEALDEQFGAGRATILQVLDARREALRAEETLSLAKRDLALSGYAALALTGDILDVFGIGLPEPADPPVGGVAGSGAGTASDTAG
jgi:outer membrane protein, adhesin transport system